MVIIRAGMGVGSHSTHNSTVVRIQPLSLAPHDLRTFSDYQFDIALQNIKPNMSSTNLTSDRRQTLAAPVPASTKDHRDDP